MSYPRLRVAQGQADVDDVNIGVVIVPPSAGRKITVVDGYLRAIGGAVGTSTGAQLVDSFMHLTADATTLAATVPAVSEAESYALSIELIADHNTHTAAAAYHHKVTAGVTSTAATTEATLVAQVNKCRTAMLAHYADTEAHGNIPDVTQYDFVAATTEATDAATAIVLENLLAAYHAAHITITTGMSTVFLAWATAGLAENAVLRAGATNTTFTKIGDSGYPGRGLMLVKNGADIDTATAIDYQIKYVVEY